MFLEQPGCCSKRDGWDSVKNFCFRISEDTQQRVALKNTIVNYNKIPIYFEFDNFCYFLITCNFNLDFYLILILTSVKY